MTIADLESAWVPLGMPWWDPAKEIKGDRAAVASGFDNPDRIVKRTGNGNVFDNIRKTIEIVAATREMSQEILGNPDAFKLDFGTNGTNETTDNNDNNEGGDDESQ